MFHMRKELDDRLFKLATRSKRYLADKDYEHCEFKQFFNTINTTANRVPQELSWDNAKAMVNLAFKNIFHHLKDDTLTHYLSGGKYSFVSVPDVLRHTIRLISRLISLSLIHI